MSKMFKVTETCGKEKVVHYYPTMHLALQARDALIRMANKYTPSVRIKAKKYRAMKHDNTLEYEIYDYKTGKLKKELYEISPTISNVE